MKHSHASFTIVAQNYLAYALTLHDSIITTTDDIDFYIYCVDLRPEHLHAICADKPILSPEPCVKFAYKEMAFRYNIIEFCTSIKPQIISHLLDCGYERVTYLDPDTCLYDDIGKVLADSKGSICLTPHILSVPREEEYYPEYKHMFEGVFNLGFVSVKNTAKSLAFVDWWSSRLVKYSYADYKDGLHTDQKWCDFVPVYFRDELEILSHPGVNVAHWNLRNRKLSAVNGKYTVDDHSLILFHFSGFDYGGTGLVRRGDVEMDSDLSISLNRLADSYRIHLRLNQHEYFSKIPYQYNYFTWGGTILQFHRRILRGTPLDSLSYEDASHFYSKRPVFTSSIQLAEVTRKSLPQFDRYRNIAHFVLKVLFIILGIQKYVALIRFFEFYGRFENHSFLLHIQHSNGKAADHRSPSLVYRRK